MKVRRGREQGDLCGILQHAEVASQRASSLDRLEVVDWEAFRPQLMEHLKYGDQKKGGRRPWCPVLMLKVLVLTREVAPIHWTAVAGSYAMAESVVEGGVCRLREW